MLGSRLLAGAVTWSGWRFRRIFIFATFDSVIFILIFLPFVFVISEKQSISVVKEKQDYFGKNLLLHFMIICNSYCYLFIELAEATAAAVAVVRTFRLNLTWPATSRNT